MLNIGYNGGEGGRVEKVGMLCKIRGERNQVLANVERLYMDSLHLIRRDDFLLLERQSTDRQQLFP